MRHKIAIIGKPNVGKSTLFNKLCRKRLAITHDRPGVTRDAKIHKANFGAFEFNLVDTAGLDKSNDHLTQKMSAISIDQATDAHVILFMVDGRGGIDSEDIYFCKEIRKLSKPVILIVNKVENIKVVDQNPIYKLGFKEVVFISAEHSRGFDKLEEAIKAQVSQLKRIEEPDEISHNYAESMRDIKFSMIGRPNAGKSTLFNKLVGFERTLVSDIAGTTRDAINHNLVYKDQPIELIDTAGLRRKSFITDSVEHLTTIESINAIRRSHVVALIIDATCPLQKQDLSILQVAINEGRGVMLIINKWDLIDNHPAYKADIDEYVDQKLFEIKGLPILYISALKDKNFNKIWEALIKTMVVFNKKIGTGVLNKLFDRISTAHIAPLASNGRRIRPKYITQTASRPPTFTVFGNMVDQLPQSYSRYIYNSIREAFNLYGVPIRILYKNSVNPFENNK